MKNVDFPVILRLVPIFPNNNALNWLNFFEKRRLNGSL